MEQQRIRFLLDQYCNRQLTPEEARELKQLADKEPDQVMDSLASMAMEKSAIIDRPQMPEVRPSIREIVAIDKTTSTVELPGNLHPLITTTPLQPVRYQRRRYAWWSAAAAVLLMAAGAYIWLQPSREPMIADIYKQVVTDIDPGKEGAILTLADGRQVTLDTMHSGTVAVQQGAQILMKDGRLAYKATSGAAGEVVYNTITTAKGRQFNVVLPDGTLAWLNAASSLQYPTAFTGKERQVKITGEVYFEVAQNASQPFEVLVNNRAAIQVLGTQFNINAYEDENNISTTLLEGSVRTSLVSPRGQAYTIVLKPGQQALIPNSPGKQSPDAITLVANADTDKAMAWRRGFFNFEGVSLEEVMRQLVRWYDIDVRYEKGVPNIKFGGELSRNVKLSGLIKVLKASKVNIRLEEGGRKLVVLP